MKTIVLAFALIAGPAPQDYVACYCPLGHTSDADFWAEHEDDNWGIIPPLDWWRLYLPHHEGEQL